MENHTARHFVLQLSSLASLYLSLSFLIVMIFGVINIIFPDAANGYWEVESARQSVRVGIAVLIVFFPTYLILTRIVNKLRRTETAGSYLSLTKWLIYLSLLIGGGVLLVDLAVVIMTFLEGDITQRFVFKAAAVLLVVGSAFYYYILDARGYWIKNEKKSVLFAGGAVVLVLAGVVLGFMNIETPAAVREQKLDDKQIEDLRNIQSQVQEYYLVNNNTLPENLEALAGRVSLPVAPENRTAYTYKKVDEGFELCATFSKSSPEGQPAEFARPVEKGMIINSENWQHGTGNVCFKRVVSQLPN